MAATIQARVLDRLAQDPGRPSLAFVDARGGVRWRSRAEVCALAASGAQALGELGLEPGEVCVLVSVDPEECARGVLAVLFRGAVPLLVAPPVIQGVNSNLRQVLHFVARRTRARLALLTHAVLDDEPELDARVAGFDDLLGAGEAEPTSPTCPSGRPAAMQLTSGTTGFPRIAVWEHDRVLAALDGMAAGMGLREDDVYLNWTPLYHDMGLVNNFLLCQTRGIPLALLSPLDVVRRPASWLRALHETGATTTWSPNFGFALATERATDAELRDVRLDGVRGFWNAAERVHRATLERFLERFGPLGVRRDALRTNFGCVETVGGTTFTAAGEPYRAELVDLARLRDEGVATEPIDESPTQWVVGCGLPYPGLELGVFGEQGRRLPDGCVGEIGFRGRGRFAAYLDEPEATAATLRDGWVFPGDEGYLRGGELYWTGRRAERINLQGRKHDPSELEPVLLAIDGLRAGCFVAFGVEDESRGTEGLVVVSEVEPERESDASRLSREVRTALASELGLTVEHLLLVRKGTLTKTSSGKRRHRHFRELYRRGDLVPLYELRAGSL